MAKAILQLIKIKSSNKNKEVHSAANVFDFLLLSTLYAVVPFCNGSNTIIVYTCCISLQHVRNIYWKVNLVSENFFNI